MIHVARQQRAPLCLSAFMFLAMPLIPHAQQGPLELTSPLGRKLYALPDDPALTSARAALAANSHNPDLALKLSKAQAARRQYNEAVATDTAALASTPNNPDLLLERGHRELGLRQFTRAQSDLEHAAQLAPANLDVFYHLGLAHYFQGQFAAAAQAFTRARDLAKDAPQPTDSLIDCTAWLYVSHRRAGNESAATDAIARITPDVKNTEPHLFFYLELLRFYQGKLTAAQILPPAPKSPDDLEAELSFNTINYGVGNWYLYHHDLPNALAHFRKVVTGEAWNAWGFVGSETDLANATKHP